MDKDDELYKNSLKKFAKSKYISPGKIQKEMQVSYLVADKILNELIEEGHVSPRIGAYPCRMLRGRYKNIVSAYYSLLTKIKINIGYRTDPQEFLK